MNIGYIVHDLHDSAVRRRVLALRRLGLNVRLAGFSRVSNSDGAEAEDGALVLGNTQDGKLGARALKVVREALFQTELAQHLDNCDIIIARNLESLAIARRLIGARPLVYECLDIHRLLLGTGPAAKSLQSLEGALLARVDLIITSSPAFEREYFAHRPYSKSILQLPNRVDPAVFGGDPGLAGMPATPPEGLWTIGWFGMLRCRRTLATLLGLAAALPDTLRVLIAGKPSPAVMPDLEARIAPFDNISFHGSYRQDELPALYGECHFAWCIDWFEEGLNSAWLLPNRLYESAAFGVVPIALENVETGRWLRDRDCGLLINNAAALQPILTAMQADDYRALRRAVELLPREVTVAIDSHEELVSHLKQLSPRELV